MSGSASPDVITRLLAVCDEVAALDLGRLDKAGVLGFLDGVEVATRLLPAQTHRGLARLKADYGPKALGAKTWNEVLRVRWRLSRREAGRRLAEGDDLQPRPAITGPPLPPVLPAVAAARDGGLISAEQLTLLRKTVNAVPKWVDPVTRSQVEVELVRVAVGQGYQALRDAAALRLFLLDQDGPEPDDEDRARRRGVRVGEQGRDGMTPFTAMFDPAAMAVWEPLLARFAAPGMCNPADPEPCISGTPTQTQIDADDRTLQQRQHDAVVFVGKIALSTDLGRLNGLPVSIIIRTTVQDLESRGIAITGGGTLVGMDDLDRFGGHAAYHLCVFDEATGSALNHFRSKRVATAAQRIMLISRDGGCTKPGCPIGPYGCQVHHAVADFGRGGNTNVDEMALACGPDNRLVDPDGTGWTTAINDRHVCEWTPPADLDTGQDRTNILHNPDALLTPTDDDEPVAPTPPAPPVTAPDDDDDPAAESDSLDIWDFDAPPFGETPPTPTPDTDTVPDTPPVQPEAECEADRPSPARPRPDTRPPAKLTRPRGNDRCSNVETTRTQAYKKHNWVVTRYRLPKSHRHNETRQPGAPPN